MEQEQDGGIAVVDLAARAAGTYAYGAVWAFAGEQLNANMVVLENGMEVGIHINDEVEVLMTAILGEGTVTVEGIRHTVRAGQALVIPMGKRRAIVAVTERFAYLTCHQRRGLLWPRPSR